VRGDTRGRDTGRFALPRKACRAGTRRVLSGCGNSGRTGGFTGLGGSLLGAGRLGNGICWAVCGRDR